MRARTGLLGGWRPNASATPKRRWRATVSVDKITLDREVFKALASDTRLDILKALDVRQKTVTELAKELDLNKATVFEHLEKLASVGLIQKVEEDVERKWVYWQLSWTGRRLLHPETITLALLLSTAGGSALTAFAALWLWLRSGLAGGAGPEGPTTMDAPAQQAMRAVEAAPPPVDAGAADPLWMGVAIGFAAVALALIVVALWVHLRAAKRAAGRPS